jgi:phosphate:Na+ symporter
MTTFSVFDLFFLAGGVCLFLYGMQLGEKNVTAFGASRLRRIIALITRHRLLAFAAGFALTVFTQSSSATTVMLVGLAAANLLTLHQSLGMILGSDLGTTLTVQLFAFKFHELAPLFIAIGFICGFQRKSARLARYGSLILAFGFVFFGMNMMAQSVAPLRSIPWVRAAIEASLRNPLWGLLMGTAFTAIVQSSAATLAICISLAESYATPSGPAFGFASYLPLVLGANLGTCATAFLSTVGANAEGARVAWAHFLFKAAGAALVFPLLFAFDWSSLIGGVDIRVAIAGAHTLFNLGLAIAFLPFLKGVSAMITRRAPVVRAQAGRYHLAHIQKRSLALPALALTQASHEISRMAGMVRAMMRDGRRLIEAYDPDLHARVRDADDEVDYLHEEIIRFITHLSQAELDHEASVKAYESIMVTNDLEHIGDLLSKSVVTFAHKIDACAAPLPERERRELLDFYDRAARLLDTALDAFHRGDRAAARTTLDQQPAVQRLFERYCDRHFSRLYANHDPSLLQTAIHVDLLEEINRINVLTFRITAHVLTIYRSPAGAAPQAERRYAAG